MERVSFGVCVVIWNLIGGPWYWEGLIGEWVVVWCEDGGVHGGFICDSETIRLAVARGCHALAGRKAVAAWLRLACVRRAEWRGRDIVHFAIVYEDESGQSDV